MKIRNKIISLVLAATVIGTGIFGQAGMVNAAQINDVAEVAAVGTDEVEAMGVAQFEDGIYLATFTSVNSMFKAQKTRVVVENGSAVLKLYLDPSKTSWPKYYLGSVDEATADVEGRLQPDTSNGEKIISIPVTAFDTVIPVAGYSSKNNTFSDVSVTVSSASMVKLGTYEVGAISKINPAMFKVDKAMLTVTEDAMSAVITLSGTGYPKLYMGTAADAATADASAYIEKVEDENGKYTFTIPVTGLNQDIAVAAYGTRGDKWYDRTLEFCVHNYAETITPATITAAGSVKNICSKCGTEEILSTIPAASQISLSETSYSYNGSVQKPSVIVKDSKGAAISTDYYSVSYSNANSTAAGNYNTTVTFKGNYTGTKTLSYTIAANTGVKATLVKTSLTYNGKAQKPAVKVTDSKGNTVSSDNYTVSYSKGSKNVGTYKATITFKGNYSGTKSLTYKINPKSTKLLKVIKGKKSITVKIKKNAVQTTGYQIQTSLKKSFTGAKTTKVKSSKTTTVKVNKLKANKKYYVRVRTFKKVGSKTYTSTWSKALTVRTK